MQSDQIIHSSGSLQIGIWGISQQRDELMTLTSLTPVDLDRLATFKQKERQCQFLAARALLTRMGHDPCNISYNEQGKPFLRDTSTGVSFSHAHTYAAVAVADRNIGIDIEMRSRTFDRIADRYLSQDELSKAQHIRTHLPEILALAWSGKEAAYKWDGAGGLDFRKDLHIQSWPDPKQPENGFLIRCRDHLLQAGFISREDFVLVYVTKYG
ncbi:MAG: 4'-phosphopantetheinyl transferase superfamily protein [Flavobacteriales bacterium]|nr:4'-phosphopantetheinyl transferase superfamily protein [Flavobacteriales bacterium]MCB9448416.1 4'-phosphopantetheinyl transferase superfamily protein [Flavobacteriales bacterium]